MSNIEEKRNQEELVLADNEIVCMLTNRVVKVSDKELTLQQCLH